MKRLDVVEIVVLGAIAWVLFSAYVRGQASISVQPLEPASHRQRCVP